MTLTITDFAAIIGAQSSDAATAVTKISGFSIDSRKVRDGDVFFALKGPNFDGHQFVRDAQSQGAAAAIVEKVCAEIDLPQLLVDDTHDALAKTAQWWRRQHEATVISVCGSNGKTTVKNILTKLLESLLDPSLVLGTQGNLNNHIGVPLTLFRLNPRHRVAVIEMGANHPGEISPLADMAAPDIAIITNAGLDHLEGFGSITGSAQTNAEVLASMINGIAILNADDAFFPMWREQAHHLRVISFASHGPADVSVENIESTCSGSCFTVCYRDQRCRFELNIPGRHNINNVLATTAALLAIGKPLPLIAESMVHISPEQGRLSVQKGLNDCRLIDDSYNANPTSLEAALEYLQQCAGHSWLILGDMGELGTDAERLHFEAGRQARLLNINKLLSYGELSRHAQAGFTGQGQHFEDMDALVDYLKNTVQSSDTLLIKGSRSMKMERIVNAMKA